MSFLGVPPTGFPTIVLSCVQDHGPGGYSLHHFWGPALRPHCGHGLLPHHAFWETPEVNLTPKLKAILFSMRLLLFLLTWRCFNGQILVPHWWHHQGCCVWEEGEDPHADQLWAGLQSSHAALPSVFSCNEQPWAWNQCPDSKTQHEGQRSVLKACYLQWFSLFHFFILLFRNCTLCPWGTKPISRTPESTIINTWWLISKLISVSKTLYMQFFILRSWKSTNVP